ncbi:RepB family plasmid replication initiator protein [Thiofilum sp.]|uniref:RepB family plasmid replication initiator protein n=1 Tax=Thiofilum sp. TaxID=2212733 RepID=UPI00345AC7A4
MRLDEPILEQRGQHPLTIHADSYITHFDAHKNTAYSALQEACKNLFERRFTYQEINKWKS